MQKFLEELFNSAFHLLLTNSADSGLRGRERLPQRADGTGGMESATRQVR